MVLISLHWRADSKMWKKKSRQGSRIKGREALRDVSIKCYKDATLKGLAEFFLSCSFSWQHSASSCIPPLWLWWHLSRILHSDERYADLATFPVHMPVSEDSKARSLLPDLCTTAIVQPERPQLKPMHIFLLLLSHDESRLDWDSLLLQKLKDVSSRWGNKFTGLKQICAGDQWDSLPLAVGTARADMQLQDNASVVFLNEKIVAVPPAQHMPGKAQMNSTTFS